MPPELLKLLAQFAAKQDASAAQQQQPFQPPAPQGSIGPPLAGSNFQEGNFAERKLAELQQEPIAQQMPGELNLQAILGALDPGKGISKKAIKALQRESQLEETRRAAMEKLSGFFADPSARAPGLTGRTVSLPEDILKKLSGG